MKYIKLLILALMVSGSISAQTISRDVSPSSGGNYSNGAGSLSWTLGETITPTLQVGSNMLTQGFQQPESQLSTDAVVTTICAGSPISVPFTAFDIFPGNTFTAQLSDAAGSFATPVDIGTLAGVSSGIINAIIPSGTTAGNGYRIRVVSSVPILIGTDNGSDITIDVAPVISCPANITVNNDPGICGATVNFAATATGSPAPAITYSHAPGSVFPIGTTIVTATADNVCGMVSCNFTITVIDNQPPVITCPADISVFNDPGECGAMVSYTVTSSDNCPGETVIQTNGFPSGSVFPVGTTTNIFSVTDASGNTATCSFSVTVSDNEAPTITNVPANFSACNPISWTPPTITDNCPGVQVTSSHTPGSVFPSGTTTVTYTATDAYNQQTSASFDVTVLEPSVAADEITSNRDYNNICLGENITLTLQGGILGQGSSWQWYSGSCGGTSAGTGTSITVSPTSTTTYFARAEGTCNTTACVQITVVVSTGSPLSTPTYTDIPAYGAPGLVDTIKVAPVPGATYYYWFTNNGQINGVLFNNGLSPQATSIPEVEITFVLSQQNYQIRVRAGNACGISGQRNTHIRGTVTATTCLNGPTQVCPGQTHTYTACPIPSQSGNTSVSYNWELIPASAGTISGSGTSVNVTFTPGFTSAQLCVNGVSSFGLHGPVYCINISTNAPAPGAVSGPSTPCEGSVGNYSIAAVPGAIGYTWSSTVPGAIVVGSGTSASVTFPTGSFSGVVCVASLSACGISTPSCIAVTSGAAGNPGPISGPVLGICGASNVNYSLGTSDANSYNWIVPSGVTLASANGSNSINLNFGAGFTSGTITVEAFYDCGSATSSISVSGEPVTPTVNPATICAGTNELYFASATGADSYNWTITGDVNSFCTNPPICSQYYVEWSGLGGTMLVTATNACGTSNPFNLSTNCRITEAGSLDTKVYPNPTTGLLTVEFTSYAGGQYNLTVTDFTGRIVMIEDFKAVSGMNRRDIDLGFANSGMYMLYLTDSKGSISVTKLTVE